MCGPLYILLEVYILQWSIYISKFCIFIKRKVNLGPCVMNKFDVSQLPACVRACARSCFCRRLWLLHCQAWERHDYACRTIKESYRKPPLRYVGIFKHSSQFFFRFTSHYGRWGIIANIYMFFLFFFLLCYNIFSYVLKFLFINSHLKSSHTSLNIVIINSYFYCHSSNRTVWSKRNRRQTVHSQGKRHLLPFVRRAISFHFV